MRQTARQLPQDAGETHLRVLPETQPEQRPGLRPLSTWLGKIHNRDCVAGMKEMPNGCVDLVLTDPPFAIEFQKAGGQYNRKSA